MLYSVYQELKPDADYTYKLLQLPPDLLQTIESGDGDIVLKSTQSQAGNHLVVCNNNTTWKLRQMNHSNHVELLDNVNFNQRTLPSTDQSNKLIGFANLSYEYELTPFSGLINTQNIPIYNGQKQFESISMHELLDNSPISSQQFLNHWYRLGGCEINGKAIILSEEWITMIINLILTILISQNFDYQNLQGDIDMITNHVIAENNDYTESMVLTILQRFSSIDGSKFKLNNEEISKWFGKQALSNSPLKLWKIPQFLLFWKSNLPEFYNVSLDLIDLKGYYCRPTEDTIKYIDSKSLSMDPQTRFLQLFKFAPNWEYQEFIPFVEPILQNGKKVDSMIMKYARKKKVTKSKFIVVSK